MSRANLIAAFDAIRTTRPHLTPHEARHQEELVLQAIDAERRHSGPPGYAVRQAKQRFPTDELDWSVRKPWMDTIATGVEWALGATEREIMDLWWERGFE